MLLSFQTELRELLLPHNATSSPDQEKCRQRAAPAVKTQDFKVRLKAVRGRRRRRRRRSGEGGEEEDVAKQKRLSAASVKMKAWLSGVERKNPVSLVSLEVNI